MIRNCATQGVTFADTASIDAFGRGRMSQVETLFDSKQIFDNGPLFWDDQAVSGTGTNSTHSAATAASNIAVSASTAGKRVRQTFMRFNYQPGKSQLILCTGVLDKSGGGAGIKRGFGYYDDNNGIFLQDNEGTIQMVIRSKASGSIVDNEVDKADWNLDTMDGNGPSGIVMDFSKAQILFIDFEWLGVGRVRTGFVIGGNIYYVHEFNHANLQNVVYMSTPNLPIRYEIENTGTGVASSLDHICASVMSEGGVQTLGVLRHQDTGAITGLSANTTYILMSGRLKSGYLGAGVLIENISIIGSANDQAHWELRIGGSVTGSLSFADVTNSAVQTAIGSSSITHADGTHIDGGYFSTAQGAQFTVPNAVRLGSTISGTPQEWYLVCTPITNNITVRASVTWRELL